VDDRRPLVLVDRDGVDLARVKFEVGPRALEVRLEGFVVHVLTELWVTGDEVLVTPCVDGVGGADGQDLFQAGGIGVDIGEVEEFVVESGGRHCY